MIYAFPHIAIKTAKDRLYNFGERIKQKTWQSVESPDDTCEILNFHLGFNMPINLSELVGEVKPNLPWADNHFQERVKGYPVNPGETYKEWPFFKHVGEKFKEQGKFSHTYMERMWPKYAGDGEYNDLVNMGVRYPYGDFKDVFYLLKKDPSTRQAYLPIWFPEDTGVVHRERVPCSLGYHFIVRNNLMHVKYDIRSCDIIRHMRDDIYLACRLVYHLLGALKETSNKDDYHFWSQVRPGQFNMHITSLHCFWNERELLLKDKY